MTRVVRNQKPKESLSVIYSWISLLCWKWVEFLPSPASLVHFRPTHAFAWLPLHSSSPVRRHYTAYFGDCIKGWLELPIDGRKIFWIALVLCYELCSVIDLGISRLCLSQSGAKPKLTATWSMAFSRALESLSSHCLLVILLSSDWPLRLICFDQERLKLVIVQEVFSRFHGEGFLVL